MKANSTWKTCFQHSFFKNQKPKWIFMYRSLQSGRAIAALLVVLFHLGGAIASEQYFGFEEFSIPFSFGDSGVEFFFVLSGFIIFYVHNIDLGDSRNIGSYIYKRMIRIYPAYIIIFSGVYLAAILIPATRDTVPHDFSAIIKALLLIPQDKDVTGGTGAPVLGVAWTLQFEMMFYLGFALAILRKALGFILISVYLLGLSIGLKDFAFPLSFIFSEYVLLFLMGILIAYLLSFKMISRSNPFIFAVTGLTIYSLNALAKINGLGIKPEIQTIMYGASCSIIVLSMILYERDGKIFLNNRFSQLLGSASYSLYLIHYPLISILCKISILLGLKDYGYAGAMMSYIFILFACIAVSIVFHVVIEKPVGRWLKSLWTRNILQPSS
ncbi:acyltransferase [Marinobacter sp. MA]|uniref:acyltransferase family protein n=1 Tax=Marinobacter sp. MA TaxID=2971606 RepID=UPI003AAAE9B7